MRTGLKPTRASYPCQRAAAANVSALLGAATIPPLLSRLSGHLKLLQTRKRIVIAIVLFAAFGLVAFVGLSSRTVLPLADGVLGGTTLSNLAITLDQHNLAGTTPSDIFAVQDFESVETGFGALLRLMKERGLAFYSLFSANDVVLIKVNSQWNERGGTNTDLVRSVIEAIHDHPDGFRGEIIVADNGQGQFGSGRAGGSFDWKYNNAMDRTQSIQEVVDSFSTDYEVSAYLWDRITTNRVLEYSDDDYEDGYVLGEAPSPATGITVSYPKFKTVYGTHVSFRKGIWNPATGDYDYERLKVINLPVLKTHMIYEVTGALKHYMGVVSDKLTRHNAHRSVGKGGMGTQMAESRTPVLNILDAIWINAQPKGGPSTSYGEAIKTNIIATSRDPLAIDYWAVREILIPAASELGYTKSSIVDPDSTARGSFGDWLRLSMHELLRGGYSYTIDLDSINVSVTSPEKLQLDL